MQKKKIGEIEELYGELGQAFNFTQGDLEANRAGFISKRQAEAVKRKTIKDILVMQVTTALFVFLAVLFIYGGFAQDAAIFCIAAPFILFAIVLIILSLSNYAASHQDLAQRRIEDAIFQRRQLPAIKNRVDYFLLNAKTSLKITSAQYALLGEKAYHVYYTPRNHNILSIEGASPEES